MLDAHANKESLAKRSLLPAGELPANLLGVHASQQRYINVQSKYVGCDCLQGTRSSGFLDR
jgi:hypothetical protein